MSNMTRMLYKAPGQHDIHGARLDYIVVEGADMDELDVATEDAEAKGWHRTTPAALAAAAPEVEPVVDTSAPNRAELEQKAAELGIDFRSNISDAKLGERIAAALAAAG